MLSTAKMTRLTEAAAPLLAASFADDRVARRADDAWSRIKPEDPSKQPADVRVACGAFVRKGGRQQPLTLGKRSVEAPTPAPKKLKTPISGVSGDARLSYALGRGRDAVVPGPDARSRAARTSRATTPSRTRRRILPRGAAARQGPVAGVGRNFCSMSTRRRARSGGRQPRTRRMCDC